jgi:hypothetical protein
MLIIVRKIWFDELRGGSKRHEYRRYGRTFNERVFWPGRRIAFGYRDRTSPRLHGHVASFATVPLSAMPEMAEIYPDMADDELIAAIGVDLDCWSAR